MATLRNKSAGAAIMNLAQFVQRRVLVGREQGHANKEETQRNNGDDRQNDGGGCNASSVLS